MIQPIFLPIFVKYTRGSSRAPSVPGRGSEAARRRQRNQGNRAIYSGSLLLGSKYLANSFGCHVRHSMINLASCSARRVAAGGLK